MTFDDTWRSFDWPRTVFPNPATYDEYLFGYEPVTVSPDHRADGYASSAAAYLAGGNPETVIVNPFAGLIRIYQRYIWLPGTVYGLILLLGLAGLVLAWRRRDPAADTRTDTDTDTGADRGGRGNDGLAALLPWACSLALIVAPAATSEFDYRYVTTAVPFGCLALAVAFGRTMSAGRGWPGCGCSVPPSPPYPPASPGEPDTPGEPDSPGEPDESVEPDESGVSEPESARRAPGRRTTGIRGGLRVRTYVLNRSSSCRWCLSYRGPGLLSVPGICAYRVTMASGVYVEVPKQLADTLIMDGFRKAGVRHGVDPLSALSAGANLVSIFVARHEIARFVAHLWALARGHVPNREHNSMVIFEHRGQRVAISLDHEGLATTDHRRR